MCVIHPTVESDADNQGYVPSNFVSQDLSWNFIALASVEASLQTIGFDTYLMGVEVETTIKSSKYHHRTGHEGFQSMLSFKGLHEGLKLA